MTSASVHFKLGLLALAAMVAIASMVVILAIRRTPVNHYHTYFDESVQGLDTGAMVKFRGVPVGKVTGIAIAPDHRLIDVELSITRGALDPENLTPKLRAELTTYGITGVKLIDLDVETRDAPPPPALVFIPPTNYIPSRPSLFSGLTRRLDSLSNRMIVVVDRAAETMDAIHQFATTATAVADDARVFLRRANVSTAKLDRFVDSAGSATNAARDLVRTTQESTSDLGDALRETREAARAMSLFLDALERDPDMLIKGRSARRKHR